MDVYERVEIQIPSPSKLFTPAVTVILVLMVIGFTLICYARNFTLNNLALVAENVIQGKVWEIITYSYINGCILNLIFNMMIVLFMGSSIEREWGTKSFLALWLVTGVVCGIIWILISLVTGKIFVGIGTDACVYGIIATFGLLYRGTRMWFYFFVLEAQYIAYILIGIGLILCIPQPICFIWVFGALVGYLYVKLRWRMASPRSSFSSTGSRTPKRKNNGSNGFIDID